jgi:hypothetical protein
MYNGRSFVEGGGLISYGTNFADNYRLVGDYAGKVLKGGSRPICRLSSRRASSW